MSITCSVSEASEGHTSLHSKVSLAVLYDSSRSFRHPSRHPRALFEVLPAPMDDRGRIQFAIDPLQMLSVRDGIACLASLSLIFGRAHGAVKAVFELESEPVVS